MILVMNCIKDQKVAESFNLAILRPIEKLKQEADFLWMPTSRKRPALAKYSHFIISGSEASVVDDNPWEDNLKKLIDGIIDKKKPLLGICYGHQFMARALLGRQAVRHSPTPEFGWMDIPLAENPLFKGITDPVFMVSHYDEVCHLTDDFKVLASSPRCAVHAFQYKNLPVWGVQFHPEYKVKEAEEIFNLLREEDSSLSTYFFNKLRDEAHLEQNERIFLNFLAI